MASATLSHSLLDSARNEEVAFGGRNNEVNFADYVVWLISF